ncbi:MAG TPA: class I SAM-dependent methyltransferase, partial [Thermoanaerobaculia bacterium]|nr:class I SAM-dependent methyltransferase [Thermoanaerobaculia bacterium]
AYSNSSDSVIVQALCRDLLNRDINLNISDLDEMLLFFLYAQGNSFDQAVAMYLDSGRRIWATQRQILAWRFGSLEWGGNILDFASGYGRVARHIVAEVPSDRVWVSDIYAEGVAFQERQLGVHGLVSTTDPADFRCDVSFDCILVSSLFTHLPESSFIAWLQRLGSLLTESGVLLFSVHDESLRPPGAAAMPASGMLFEEQSESGSLDTKDYGTSWVTEDFVRSAVQRAMGICPVLRIPRGLASFQDLYVVLKGAEPSPAAFSGLMVDREADGFLEHCSWAGKRSLRLSGWAADRVTGRPPLEVRVRIDDVLVASCRDLQPRPSAGQAFVNDPAEAVGWQTTVDLPATSAPESARLSVRPVAIDGQELDLYTCPVAAACLRTAQLDTVMLQQELRQREVAHREELARQSATYEELLGGSRARAEELAQRIHAMEASRFWKARNLWFRLKRTLGLTREL